MQFLHFYIRVVILARLSISLSSLVNKHRPVGVSVYTVYIMDEKWREDFARVMNDGPTWIRETLCVLPRGAATHPMAVSSDSFTCRKEITKEIMAKRLSAALKVIYNQNQIINHLENQTQQLKTAIIENQNELISAKNEQLVELKETVVSSVSSVGDAVKTQLKSYSEAVVESGNQADRTGGLLDQNVLKTVVKNVVAEEDRSRNLIVFGLPEDPAEHITDKVGEVLLELGEKPKLEAVRVGLKRNQETPRPVKVSFGNATIAAQILSKSRNLRNSGRFKLVFISPDRNSEQRVMHRKLVEQLRTKRTDEPSKRHFIKGGQIISADK